MAIEKSTDEKEKMPFEEDAGDAQEFPDGLPKEYLKVIEDLRKRVDFLETTKAAVSDYDYDEDNPVEDFLEQPAVFFAFSTTYSIFGDKRKNRESLPPRDEPVKFEKLYRYQKPSSGGKRGSEVITVSQAVIRSKSTAEWLRGHTLFGIKFFENINKAQNVNVTLAEKMSEMNGVVMNMNDHAVIERAKREQIPITSGDISLLRKQLVRKLAEDAIKREKHVHEMKLRNGEFDENGRKIEQGKVGEVDADLETTSVY
jgi:hypothetical protein